MKVHDFIKINLTFLISLLMGFCAFYTWRIGWYPDHVLWKTEPLLRESDVPWIMAISVVIFFIISFGFKRLSRFSAIRPVEISVNRRLTLFISLFLLLLWLPYFLVFYPGTGMNDTTDIMRSGVLAMIQHTLAYIIYIWGLTQLSDLLFHTKEFGLAAASLIQMVVMAWVIGFCLSRFYRWTGQRKLLIALILYYGFTPMIINMSFSNVKDVFFSISILLFVPVLFSFASSSDFSVWKNNRLLFIAAGLAMAFFRNNGLIPFAVLALIIVFFLNKKVHLNYLLIVLLMLVGGIGVEQMVRNHYAIPYLLQERAGIQIQQFGRAVTLGRPLTAEEKAYSRRMITPGSIEKLYDPFFVDTIKWTPEFNFVYFNGNPSEFYKNWKSTWERNKRVYIDAWLLSTYGFWAFPAPDGMVQSRFGHAFTEQDITYKWGMKPKYNNEFRIATIRNFFPPWLQEFLGSWLWKHSRYAGAGTCFWITMMIGLLLVYRKQYRRLLVLLPSSLIWGTLILATPAAFVYRYVYFFPLCMPFFILLPFLPNGRYGETKWAETMLPQKKEEEKSGNISRVGDGYTHWKD